MPKLTLSTDRDVVVRARKLAADGNTSISAMFSRFVRAMSQRTPPARIGPIARKASGMIVWPKGKTDRQVLEEALLERHGHR
jgi:hypothetical protein